MSRQITSVEELQEALVGQVMTVEAQSPHGDYVLVFKDGRRVTIDCGYVGATVYVQDIDACPGCGCRPGDGLTDGCEDPDGCGYFRS